MPLTKQPNAACEAKTRQGSLCKNEGNARNGRCHLHGGSSTGPKSSMGKLKISQNAAKKMPKWSLGVLTNKDQGLIDKALIAAKVLMRIVEGTYGIWTDERLNTFISGRLIELEVMKYEILKRMGNQTFVVVQSALDHYYQDQMSPHTECHLYFWHSSSPHFPRIVTNGQQKHLDEYLDKSACKEMRKLERDFEKMHTWALK